MSPSKTLALESPVSAMPMESLRFIPPESVLVREWHLSSRLRILRMWLISSGHLEGGYPFSCQIGEREG